MKRTWFDVGQDSVLQQWRLELPPQPSTGTEIRRRPVAAQGHNDQRVILAEAKHLGHVLEEERHRPSHSFQKEIGSLLCQHLTATKPLMSRHQGAAPLPDIECAEQPRLHHDMHCDLAVRQALVGQPLREHRPHPLGCLVPLPGDDFNLAWRSTNTLGRSTCFDRAKHPLEPCPLLSQGTLGDH